MAKTEGQSMADTRIMEIIHSALRRDLNRAADALSGIPAPGNAQRVGIAQHIQWMMHFLHLHHGGEDAWLWPTMRRLKPSAAELVDLMVANHLAIAPHIETVTTTASAYEKSADGLDALVQELGNLRGPLDPHLRREVDDMMPIVATTLTARQWDDWEGEYYIKPKSKNELGMQGLWLIDGVNRSAYDVVVGKVNPVLRFFLLHVFGPKYRQECAMRWGVDVPVAPKLT